MTDPYRDLVSRLTRFFGGGGTVTVRRAHNLSSRITGGAATPLLKTALVGGESSFVLDGGLVGKVPSGLTVTLGGVDYTTTSSAEAANGEITLAVTPVIAGAVAEDSPATLAAYVELSFTRVFSEMQDSDLALADTSEVESGTRRVHLAYATTAPEVGDILVEGDDRWRVYRVKRLGPTGTSGWTVFVGEA